MTGAAAAGGSKEDRRPSPRAIVVGLVFALAVGGGLGAAVHLLASSGASSSKATASIVLKRHGLYGEAQWANGAVAAPQINTLKDQSGNLFSLSSLRGTPVAIVFWDSHCHQECPLMGHQLASSLAQVPAASRPTLVIVSVNPKDTPASAEAAIRHWGLAPEIKWHWLMGTHTQLAPVWARYHEQVAPPQNGDIAHTEAMYLVNRKGFERAAFIYPFKTGFVAYDMKQLAGERG